MGGRDGDATVVPGGEKPKAGSGRGVTCKACGGPHKVKYCQLKKHPNANRDGFWDASAAARAWKAAGGGDALIRNKKLVDGRLQPMSTEDLANLETGKEQAPAGLKGEELFALMFGLKRLKAVFPVILQAASGVSVQTTAFGDSGANDGNYVSAQFIAKLRDQGFPVAEYDLGYSVSISCPLAPDSSRGCNFNLSFLNEITGQWESLPLFCTIVDTDVFGIAVGLDVLRRHDMFVKLPSVYSSKAMEEQNPITDVERERREFLGVVNRVAEILDSSAFFPGTAETEEDPFEGVADLKEFLPSEEVETSESILAKIEFGGTPQLRAAMRDLCLEKIGIFSKHLAPVPIRVAEMDIELVEGRKFETAKMKASARPLSPEKLRDLQQQIDEYLRLGIIRPSQEQYRSQVLLVPKNDGTWRFCIDFRFLNSITVPLCWPLPNMAHIFDRLRQRKPKVYGSMDFTKGYFQCMLKEAIRRLTAFVTPFGTYEWNRVPMGLTGAPSFFQQQMAEVVLKGLVNEICEQYLDDVLLYADDEQQFLDRMRTLFNRFEEFGVTLNPSKCKFGMPSTKFLGHMMDEDGRWMAPEQVDRVKAIPQPTTQGDLKSFLGLVNYFRDFMPNMSDELKLMNNMILSYSKKDRSKALKWSPEEEEAFRKVKEQILVNQKVYYPSDSDPVFLMTDASNFGVGAYLYQRGSDGKAKPVIFLSRSFRGSELNWSTIEKEAFAIVFAFKRLGHLLQSMPFTLQTDHANLLYISESCSPKVIRWKLAIQEFRFKIEHVEGEKNVAADFFSRHPPQEEFAGLQRQIANMVFEEKDSGSERDGCTPIRCYQEYLFSLAEENRYSEEQKAIIGKFHNSLAGHFGCEKTVKKMREHGHNWVNLRAHVQRFIRQCPVCQKLSERNVPVVTKPFLVNSLRPMEQVHMDTIGPLNEEIAGKPRYVLVMIDAFTRFVELVAVEFKDAQTYAAEILKYIGRYGAPTYIQTDGGTEFQNAVVELVTAGCGSNLLKTNPGSKQENAIVERANKEVLRHLRGILYENIVRSEWSTFLPLVQRIMNSAVHESLGVSPAQLVFGNNVDLDARVLHQEYLGVTSGSTTYPEYLEKLVAAQTEILRVAQKHQREVNVGNLVAKRSASPETEYLVGSYVLVRHSDSMVGDGPPSKLQMQWKGPLRIVERDGCIYIVQDLVNNKTSRVHVSRMKPFHFEKEGEGENEIPRQVANRDYESVDIAEILSHTCVDPKKRSTYEFKVRWEGFDASHDEWKPWKEVKDNAKLHQYLRDHHLRRFIDKRYREDT